VFPVITACSGDGVGNTPCFKNVRATIRSFLGCLMCSQERERQHIKSIAGFSLVHFLLTVKPIREVTPLQSLRCVRSCFARPYVSYCYYTESVAYAENFHWVCLFSGMWWSFLFRVCCAVCDVTIGRHIHVSKRIVLAKFVDTICIFSTRTLLISCVITLI